MSSSIEPEYRLRNLKRRLGDLLMSRRLSANPEATGIVELADFGKKCDALAEFAAESVTELNTARGAEARCAARIAEEIELAARLAARMETLPRSIGNIDLQCDLLEETGRMLDAALEAELLQEEPDVRLGLGPFAEAEKELFLEFLEFEGEIGSPPPALVPRGQLQRCLRRALLDHEDGPFRLSVTDAGTIEFGEFSYDSAAATGDGPEDEAETGTEETELPRSSGEPPDAKQALDLFAISDDESLKDFLLVKAVDAALLALLGPKLGSHEWVGKARELPHRPGKRQGVRPEAVQRPVEGWEVKDAQRAADRLSARRAGPEWAKLPNAAYMLRLFWLEDDRLAADLLALGPALKRMERGESVEGVRERATRCWKSLAGLL
ncbi:MAG: hypothetical protein ACYTGZ_15450 [Planctomycetota bacterium]|jgi:hypothetical protein